MLELWVTPRLTFNPSIRFFDMHAKAQQMPKVSQRMDVQPTEWYALLW